MNEFKFNEVKKLQNQKKVFYMESFILDFIPNLAKLSLSGKITSLKEILQAFMRITRFEAAVIKAWESSHSVL